MSMIYFDTDMLNQKRQLVNHVRHNSQQNDQSTKEFQQMVIDKKREKVDNLRQQKMRASQKVKAYRQSRVNQSVSFYNTRKLNEREEIKSSEQNIR